MNEEKVGLSLQNFLTKAVQGGVAGGGYPVTNPVNSGFYQAFPRVKIILLVWEIKFLQANFYQT